MRELGIVAEGVFPRLKKGRAWSTSYSVLILLTGLVFVASVCAAILRPAFMRKRRVEISVTVFTSVAVILYAWRLAFPQENVDFDTWLELSAHKTRVDHVSDLLTRQRPLQNCFEYYILTILRLANPNLIQCRVGLYITLLVFVFLLMTASRHALFGSRNIALPIAAMTGFLLTAGGEFLIDSWNDHLPLVLFYLLGIVSMLKFRAAPARMAVPVWLVFLAGSMMHTAEPWLWSAGLFVCILPARGYSRRGRVITLVLLCAMVFTSLTIISLFPGGATAAVAYLGRYRQKFIGDHLVHEFAEGFSRGGIIAVPQALLFSGLAALLALMMAMPASRPRYRDLLFLVWFVLAALYPAIYETRNPERYATLAFLWPLIGVMSLRRAMACRRLSMSFKQTSVRRAFVLAPALIAGIFLFQSVACMPRIYRALDRDHVYNIYGRLLARTLDPRGSLFIAPTGTFYLWMQYWYSGQVRTLSPDEDALGVINSISLRPLYVNEGARKRAESRTSVTLEKIFERPGDPATMIYRW